MHNHVTRSEVNVHVRKWMKKYVSLYDKHFCVFRKVPSKFYLFLSICPNMCIMKGHNDKLNLPRRLLLKGNAPTSGNILP